MIANLLFFGVALAVLANLGALAAKLVRLRADAAAAWDELRAAGGDGLDEAAFRRAYFRAYGPRGALHAVAGVLIAAAVSPIAIVVLDRIWVSIWHASGEPFMYTHGFLLWQFYMFFGLIASWVGVAALIARRYHRNRPRELRIELARERERAA